MKIAYCTASTYAPGGMERVLANKIAWLSAHKPEWEILVITTDQKGREPYYRFPESVKCIDLNINYSDDNHLNPVKKIANYLKKRRRHRKALTHRLLTERPDIVISLFPSESSFIPDIPVGCKVLELHFNRYFRLQYDRKGILRLADLFRTWRDRSLVRRFDRFVVLTPEDRELWGQLPNIEVVPNAAIRVKKEKRSEGTAKRVIAVGRLDYQKGFDRLIEAWGEIAKRNRLNGWRLDIFGKGEWEDMLKARIEALGIVDSAAIHLPVKEIGGEYKKSSVIAMTSHFEGFPMVLIEGMSYQLVPVVFNFKCGPKDIIKSGCGEIVEDGDIQGFADALIKIMEMDSAERAKIAQNAVSQMDEYTEEKVMAQWLKLFKELTDSELSEKQQR